MSSNVTVLAINGRRQNVKVVLSTTMLEVLEIVCKKQNLDPEKYILLHHSKQIDLNVMFRFAGIPNNALLEMEDAKVPRVVADVVIMIQLESGDRHQGTFKTSATILELIQNLTPEFANYENTVIIYMRREVFGEQLATTTLRSLGLSGGRAILRLVQKKPDSLKQQAHVSAPLPVKEKIEVVEEEKKIQSNEPKKAESPTIEYEPKKVKTEDNTIEKQPEVAKMNGNVDKSKEQPSTSSSSSPPPMEIEIQDDFPDPVINIIGEKEALIFPVESATRNAFDDIPDDFFDITIDDIKKLYRDLREKAKSMQEAPLITAKLREQSDNEKMSSKIDLYKQTVIRIQFPGRVILQGIFEPTMTFADVKKFVCQFLVDPLMEFHLYTTPPKEIVKDEDTLLKAKCVPQALIHFGSDAKLEKFLKEELYEQFSNASGASLTAVRARGLKYRNADGTKTTKKDDGKVKDSEFRQSSVTQSKSKDVKLPKWFKFGK